MSLELARLIADIAATRESTANAIWNGPPTESISGHVRFCKSRIAAISGLVSFNVRRYLLAGVEAFVIDVVVVVGEDVVVVGEDVVVVGEDVVVVASLHGAPFNHQSE